MVQFDTSVEKLKRQNKKNYFNGVNIYNRGREGGGEERGEGVRETERGRRGGRERWRRGEVPYLIVNMYDHECFWRGGVNCVCKLVSSQFSQVTKDLPMIIRGCG